MTNDPVYQELGRHPDIELGVMPLPLGLGWWMADQRVILAESRITRRQRRCVVAHELEHALAGDEGCLGTADDGYYATRAERRASSRAARKLITLDALALSMAMYEDDDDLIAEHLNVDLQTLDVRRLTATADERRYLRQRMAEREETA